MPDFTTLHPDVRRILAPNPSPMTGAGTNTYLVGRGDVMVIDPGPRDVDHMTAILGTLDKGEKITHILVTHSHLDHSPLSHDLARSTGAPVCAYGDSSAGRSTQMNELARDPALGGGEGTDWDFIPDICLKDGQKIGPITALWTPGHFGNHMCFAYQDVLFCGDHVLAETSTLISPPDGDMGAFMASCKRLLKCPEHLFFPGHGDEIHNPTQRVQWMIDHRKSREAQVLEALTQGPNTAAGLATQIYIDTPHALLPAAARNVLAHLIDLHDRDKITVAKGDRAIRFDTVFTLP